jgi:hypothetical protein
VLRIAIHILPTGILEDALADGLDVLWTELLEAAR